MNELLQRAEALAVERTDGHLTIMRFTTGWKAVLGTPDVTGDDRASIWGLRSSATLEEALSDLLGREAPPEPARLTTLIRVGRRGWKPSRSSDAIPALSRHAGERRAYTRA
jgi:hypothetical protein